MKYISTRGECPPIPARDTVLAGLAPDGGLFLPERYPDVSGLLESWRDLGFRELFQQVARLYLGDDISADDLAGLTERSYAEFGHAEVTPLVRLGNIYLVELFHGPTLAFKDVPLQFLGNLFETYLTRTGRRITVAGATSGDTGSAAIHALRGKAGVEVFMLFPEGRVSPMQERQMTTVPDANIHCIAVEGSFDDAQAILKGLFNDREFNREFSLGAVNSINWMRLMAQVVYYFYAYFRVLAEGGHAMGQPVRFAVPTGNFGNIFAGFVARRMGLPVEKLLLATNSNDILHRFISSGEYRKGQVEATLSPSMDIQVASNFERYLFELSGREAGQVREWMQALEDTGGFAVDARQLEQVRSEFISIRVSDAQTLAAIRRMHEQEGYLLDPHSAIGVHAAWEFKNQEAADEVPVVCMGAAHPAKFADAIQQAIGESPSLPPALAGLEDLPTRVHVLPASPQAVRDYMREVLTPVARPPA